MIETWYCAACGKNAMDFELSAYFGHVLDLPDTTRVSIISKDGGYKALFDFAAKMRPDVETYPADTIMEACIARQAGFQKGIYERTKKNQR